MSPEVVFKKPYETNIDVWSLGILLYELTIGSSPFRAKNLQEISQKFKNHKELIFPDYLSYDLKNLIVGILKMDPEKRMTIEQILSHKWVKKMYITSGYEEPNTSKGRLRQIEEKIERKQHILQNTKSINLWDVNDQTDRKFKTIPKNNMEISITKIRKPIFFENKQKNEENSTYVNKTEYNNRFRSSNNTNILNGSFFSRTTHTQDLSVFKSVDNSKKHKIFLQETEKNSGTVLKTMENLMSQINISENHFSQIKSNQKPMASKTHAQIDQNFMKKPEKKKNTRFLFEELRSIKGKKENIK